MAASRPGSMMRSIESRSNTFWRIRASIRRKLRNAGFDNRRQGRRAGRRSPHLPFTEKSEIRASCSASRSDGHACRGSAGRDRAHLFHERHHGNSELHSADGAGPRQLGDGFGAQLRGFGYPIRARRSFRPTMRGRSLPAPRSAPSTGSACATFRSARAIPNG